MRVNVITKQSMQETQTLYEGKFLRLIKNAHWEYVQRVNASGAVHILAITPENELLLVEQQRLPVGEVVIELPAGVIGDEAGREQETPEQAAARELVEETGYRAERVERLYQGPSSPGMASEIVTMVRAFNLQQVGEGGGVEGENITVRRIPLTEISAWLAARMAEGRLIDHKVYAALYFIRDSLKS